jgi:DNA polymerase I-like protein with 3'-5' exonuclease and polymerase domains
MRVANLPDVELVAVDTETSGLHPDDGARVASVGLAWEGGSAGLPFDQGVRDKLPSEQLTLEAEEDVNLPESEWEALLDWLSGRSLICHNAKFDITMLAAGTRMREGRDMIELVAWDSMLASRVLEPLELVGLDAACDRRGIGQKSGLDEIKAWLKSRKLPVRRYDLAPWNLVERYVVGDAEMTWRLAMAQRREAKGEDLERIRRSLDLTEALYRMERRGVAYDVKRSLQAAEDLEAAAEAIEKELPFPANITGAKRWFFEEKGMTPDRRSEKTKAPSLDEQQIRKWAGEEVEWAKEYWQVSAARRAVSMWYRGYPEKIGLDGRLRTVYKQASVRSGRMAVERVQLQAMPKGDKLDKLPVEVPGVRDLLQAREGCQLWNLDLSQAELRVAAKYAQCKEMLRMLEEGADMHGETCKRVMGVKESDPLWREKRDIAKRLTFGAIFQIGAVKFQATLLKLANQYVPLDECQDLVAAWRQTYPEFGVAYRRAEQRVLRKGGVRLLPGTEYEVESRFGERDYPNSGWNRIVQGSLAEFFNLWVSRVEKAVPGTIVLTVHDSLLLEVEEGEAEAVAEGVARGGAQLATELFGTEMKVDKERYV